MSTIHARLPRELPRRRRRGQRFPEGFCLNGEPSYWEPAPDLLMLKLVQCLNDCLVTSGNRPTPNARGDRLGCPALHWAPGEVGDLLLQGLE
jgi:hypothetical protein